MQNSPYQPPSSLPPGPGLHPQENPALIHLKVLGGIFIGLGVLGLMGGAYMVGSTAFAMSAGMVEIPQGNSDAQRNAALVGFWGSIGVYGLSGLMQILVIWSGVNMLRQKGLRMAYTGSIVSVIPCLSACCVLGIPFGIWALVILGGDNARALFAENASDKFDDF